jgi:hypothetical protein
MVANVQLVELNGTGTTATDKTSGTLRFKNADNATVDLLNPMVKGTAADLSFIKYVRFRCTVAPDGNLTNAKIYTDGTNSWTDVFLGGTIGTYTAPVEGTGTAGFANMFNYTSGGSQIDLAIGTQTGTGQFGTYLKMLMQVGTGASGGLLAGETLTLSYDEI